MAVIRFSTRGIQAGSAARSSEEDRRSEARLASEILAGDSAIRPGSSTGTQMRGAAIKFQPRGGRIFTPRPLAGAGTTAECAVPSAPEMNPLLPVFAPPAAQPSQDIHQASAFAEEKAASDQSRGPFTQLLGRFNALFRSKPEEKSISTSLVSSHKD